MRYEYFIYGALTFLVGWFSPRVFTSQKWSARKKTIFGVLTTLTMFVFLGIYRLSTGEDFTEKMQELVLCRVLSLTYCPRVPAAPANGAKSDNRSIVGRPQATKDEQPQPVRSELSTSEPKAIEVSKEPSPEPKTTEMSKESSPQMETPSVDFAGLSFSAGEIWIDVSASTGNLDRDQAVSVLLQALPDLSAKHDLNSWSAYSFSDNPSADTAFYSVNLPQTQKVDCSQQPSIWFGRCEREQSAARVEAGLMRSEIFAALANVIKDRPISLPGKCTGILDLLSRISQSGPGHLIFIVSEGNETCRPERRPTTLQAPDATTQVVFILLGRMAPTVQGTQTQAERFAAVRLKLSELAPWLTVVPQWKLRDAMGLPENADNP